MAKAMPATRFRFWLWLIALVGVIVPRRLRADWRQEWEARVAGSRIIADLVAEAPSAYTTYLKIKKALPLWKAEAPETQDQAPYI